MVSREIGRTQFVRYIVKIGEKGRNRMVSPFFCSVDCFPLTAPAPAPRGAAHPDPHTPTIASHALSGSAFLDSTDGSNSQKPVTSYYVFAYSHRQHIIFHHYVLTPPISFSQIVHCKAKPFPPCQCCLQRVLSAQRFRGILLY